MKIVMIALLFGSLMACGSEDTINVKPTDPANMKAAKALLDKITPQLKWEKTKLIAENNSDLTELLTIESCQ